MDDLCYWVEALSSLMVEKSGVAVGVLGNMGVIGNVSVLGNVGVLVSAMTGSN